MRSTPQGAARGALAGAFPSPAIGLPLTIGQAFWDDFAWAGDTGGGGGGGAVDSVNGLTGVVVLDADAVGALEPADIGTSVQAHNATLTAIAAGAWTGAASITTVGIVASGTWQGTPVGIAYGGHGQTSAAAGLAALGGFDESTMIGIAHYIQRGKFRK
jgi:hypothetical protein